MRVESWWHSGHGMLGVWHARPTTSSVALGWTEVIVSPAGRCKTEDSRAASLGSIERILLIETTSAIVSQSRGRISKQAHLIWGRAEVINRGGITVSRRLHGWIYPPG